MANESFIASRKPRREYEKPAEGQYQGVICEVKHLGDLTKVWKGVSKTGPYIRVYWQLNAKDSKGNIFYIPERDFLLSMDEKSNLFKFIKNLYKKEPPPTFDTQKLVGAQRLLTIVHNTKKDEEGNEKTYANVAAMLNLPANTPKMEIVPLPKKDEVKAEVAKSLAVTEANPITDDDIPF